MKKVFITLGILISAIIVLQSCKKDAENIQSSANDITTVNDKTDLYEFSETRDVVDKMFLQNKENIFDYTDIAKKWGKGEFKRKPRWLKVKFRWGRDCKGPIGICVIIILDPPRSNSKTIDANATGYVFQDKFILIPTEKENGLTSDGYLPLIEDMVVDEGIILKAGVYKSYFDKEKGKNIIVVDIKK